MITIPFSRSASGAASKCDNCGHVTYPVTAPVGIVSIGNESNDKLLLIRQPRQGELEGGRNLVMFARNQLSCTCQADTGKDSCGVDKLPPFSSTSDYTSCVFYRIVMTSTFCNKLDTNWFKTSQKYRNFLCKFRLQLKLNTVT